MPEATLSDPVTPTGSVAPDLQSVMSEVRELVGLVRANGLSKVRLDVGDVHIEIEAASQVVVEQGAAQAVAFPAGASFAAPPAGHAEQPVVPSGAPVRAPVLGVFYRRPAPGEPPFVEVGDVVESGQQVAIIEAMKLMNPVLADRAGTVTAIHVEDGSVVEFAETLITIEPS